MKEALPRRRPQAQVALPGLRLERRQLRTRVASDAEDQEWPEYGWRTYPKNLLRLFLRNNLTRLKITSEVKNRLKRLFFDLVLKGIFRGL